MQCTRCGHALSAVDLALADCSNCGTVLPAAFDASGGAGPRSATSSRPARSRSARGLEDNRKVVLLGLLVGGAIGLGLAGAIGVFLFRR